MSNREVYKDLKSVVNPEHSCLVVWDVQNALVNSIFNKTEFLTNLKNLISAARKSGVRIFYTMITPLPQGFESGYRLYSMMKRYGTAEPGKMRFMEPGTPEAEIAQEIKPEKDDIIIRKNTADIFIGTNFELMTRNSGIETIVLTGISTEIGVESSARSAGNRGYYPVVVKDCVSSSNREMHEMALKVLEAVSITASSSEMTGSWR